MLSPENIYLIAPILGAIFGAMLWLNYFIKIDVLEKERITDIILAFCIGFLTPNIALFVYEMHARFGFDFNNHFWNDLVYSIFGIGLTEELSKLIGVALVFILIRKRLNEPIDYLIFGGIVALGFAIRENYIYYYNYGSQIITGRTLIASLTHIINTSICVYGLFRFKIFNRGNIIVNSISGILIAIISHGLFDFFLTQQFIGKLTPFLASGIYLLGINFWIQMINNCINFSPYFNYDKLFGTTKLYKTILSWYAGLLIIEFLYFWYYKGLGLAFYDSIINVFNEGLLLVIVALRASRLKISKRKYFKIKLQSPIYLTKNDDEDVNIFGILPFKVRGENQKEFRLFQFMGKDILICPLHPEKSKIQVTRKGRLLKKYFLKNDVVVYLVELYQDEYFQKEIFILKPKTYGINSYGLNFPIASLMEYNHTININNSLNPPSYKDLKSLELVFIKQV